MNEECLICRAPLEYLNEDVEMECELCHKREKSKTRCVNGHYVCNECHTRGADSLLGLCMGERSKNPAVILDKMMAMPFCHMHGPEHHIMVGMALLTAYRNAGCELDLKKALTEMNSRGQSVPGGACGFWGACGAGISSGMFVSIATGSTPLGEENFGLSHKMTARSLAAIGEVGGPRCCKRDSWLAILEAVDFAREHLGVNMERLKVRLQQPEQPVHRKTMPVLRKAAENCLYLRSQFLQKPDRGGPGKRVSVGFLRLLFRGNGSKAPDQPGCGASDEAGVRD